MEIVILLSSRMQKMYYTLQEVSCHSGKTLQNGHYFTNVRNNENWILINGLFGKYSQNQLKFIHFKKFSLPHFLLLNLHLLFLILV